MSICTDLGGLESLEDECILEDEALVDMDRSLWVSILSFERGRLGGDLDLPGKRWDFEVGGGVVDGRIRLTGDGVRRL